MKRPNRVAQLDRSGNARTRLLRDGVFRWVAFSNQGEPQVSAGAWGTSASAEGLPRAWCRFGPAPKRFIVRAGRVQD
jgi:hypothetical protein